MLEGAPNFRDLGGIACHDGRPVRAAQLLRSSQLSDLTAADLQRVTAYRVRVLCDLRTPAERALAPNLWPRPGGTGGQTLRTVLAPERRETEAARPAAWVQRLRDPSFDAQAAREYLLGGYRNMPVVFAAVLAELFTALDAEAAVSGRAGGGPLLVHCVAGKDRTGFVCALLLEALGASRDAILADYLGGVPYNPPRRRLPAGDLPPPDDSSDPRMAEAKAVMAGVHRMYLEAAWHEIERQWRSADRYLAEAAGLDDARRARLRECLLER